MTDPDTETPDVEPWPHWFDESAPVLDDPNPGEDR